MILKRDPICGFDSEGNKTAQVFSDSFGKETFLFETTPAKADKIISIFNNNPTITHIKMAKHHKLCQKIATEIKAQLQDLVITYEYHPHMDEPADILLNAATRIADIASSVALRYLTSDIVDL